MNHPNLSTPMRTAIGLCVAGALACSITATAAGATTNGAADETAHTSAAVVAVDEHWLRAEEGGDTAWLDAMLMPGYRSISASGEVLDKTSLLAGARKNRGSDTMRKQVAAWQKTHPTRTSVVMHGDVAILSFSDPKTGRVLSSDIFVYTHGGWHALYSQHARTE